MAKHTHYYALNLPVSSDNEEGATPAEVLAAFKAKVAELTEEDVMESVEFFDSDLNEDEEDEESDEEDDE